MERGKVNAIFETSEELSTFLSSKGDEISMIAPKTPDDSLFGFHTPTTNRVDQNLVSVRIDTKHYCLHKAKNSVENLLMHLTLFFRASFTPLKLKLI